MSVVTIVGVVVTLALVACVFVFLHCFAFASSTGKHALGVDRADHVRIAETNDLGQVAHVPIDPDIVNQYGSGLDIHDDFPSDVIGPRPYLEEYWRTSGRDLVDQTIEFAAFRWVHEDVDYESVSGQLELVA